MKFRTEKIFLKQNVTLQLKKLKKSETKRLVTYMWN